MYCTGGADWYECETGRVENKVGVSSYIYILLIPFFFFPISLTLPIHTLVSRPTTTTSTMLRGMPSHSLTHSFRFLGYLLKQAYFFPFFYYFTFPSYLTACLLEQGRIVLFSCQKKSPGFSSVHSFFPLIPTSPCLLFNLDPSPPPEGTTLEGIQRNGSCCSQLLGWMDRGTLLPDRDGGFYTCDETRLSKKEKKTREKNDKKIDDYLKNNGITQYSITTDTLFCTVSYQCTSQVLFPDPPPVPPFPTARSLTPSSAGTLLAHRPCSPVEQESPYCTMIYSSTLFYMCIQPWKEQ